MESCYAGGWCLCRERERERESAATHAGMQHARSLSGHGMGRHAGGGAAKSCFPAGILFPSRIESLP